MLQEHTHHHASSFLHGDFIDREFYLKWRISTFCWDFEKSAHSGNFSKNSQQIDGFLWEIYRNFAYFWPIVTKTRQKEIFSRFEIFTMVENFNFLTRKIFCSKILFLQFLLIFIKSILLIWLQNIVAIVQ